MVLETVAASIEAGKDKYSLRYPTSKWAAALQLHPPNVKRKLAAIAATGLLELSYHESEIEVRVPNILKYRDEYQRRSGHSPDNVGSKKQMQMQNTEAEAEAEPGPAAAADPQFEESAQTLLDKHAPGQVKNRLGRLEKNPVRVKAEEALFKARTRIEKAKDPQAYERKIVRDALAEAGIQC
jgi:hypothetical protein